MTDMKSRMRSALGDVTLEDIEALIEFAPRIIAWFRARRYNHTQINHDFDRAKLDVDDAYDRARAIVEEQTAEKP